MFAPLPSEIRLHRERKGLTQDRLAKMAGVSRGQLIAFEQGENVSLAFLLKIAKALEITELHIGDLYLRPSPPDLTMLVAAADALAVAKRVTEPAADAASDVAAADARVSALLERVLMPVPAADYNLVIEAADRLAATPPERRRAAGDALREVAQPSDIMRRPLRRSKPDITPTTPTRKRGR